MRRGELWWAELLGDAGFRPVVIISRSEDVDHRTKVTVAEITTTIRSLPSEVVLTEAEGVPRTCVISTDNLHTIPKDHLIEFIAMLSAEHLFALAGALRHSLGLDW